MIEKIKGSLKVERMIGKTTSFRLYHIRKRERPIADRSLYNIMYEKKISYSQDEAYVQ